MAWLVVGFGCDLAGDDGFGIAVANMVAELRAQTQTSIEIDVMTKRILAPEFVEYIRLADGVIFADASATLPLGLVQCSDLQVLRESSQAPTGGSCDTATLMSHHCNPQNLMQLCQALYQINPPAWLYAVGASSFSFSDSLSTMVADLVPQVARQIIDKIEAECLYD